MEAFGIGPGWLRPYQESKFRLRFELGGEVYWQVTHVVPRFIQALERSRELADNVFGRGRAIAIVGSWKLQKRELFQGKRERGATGILLLEKMGFVDAPMLCEWREKPAWFARHDSSDGVPFDWRAYDITGLKEMRDTLLWASNAFEIGIEPKAPIVAYLLDPVSHVLMHVYDDRGADITALSAESLMTLLHQRVHPALASMHEPLPRSRNRRRNSVDEWPSRRRRVQSRRSASNIAAASSSRCAAMPGSLSPQEGDPFQGSYQTCGESRCRSHRVGLLPL